MNTSAVSATPPLLFGRYRLLEKLGDGRLASVYRAFDERLHRQVLLHVLRKELIGQSRLHQRFLDEINANAQISHSALLEVFDSGEVNQRPFMVTEYVSGNILYGSGALVPARAAECMRQIASAVAMCQLRGLPHPPISSRNVLLIGENRVELIESWMITPEAAALDFASYRAPEITAGSPPTPSSVVYSLGLLLYEMLTGKRAVQGASAQELATAHTLLRLPTLAESNPTLHLPAIDELLWKATQRSPERRIADAASFADALEVVWRTHSSETRRLTKRVQPAAVPRYTPNPYAPDPAASAPSPAYRGGTGKPAANRPPTNRPPTNRPPAIIGWLLLLLLIGGVALGSYTGASYLAERLFAIRLPPISISLPSIPQIRPPNIGLDVPDWIQLAPPREYYRVRIDAGEGLNLRDAPGLTSVIIATIPNGERVEKRSEPVAADGVEWVQVRVPRPDGPPLEGWMSLNFLEQEQ